MIFGEPLYFENNGKSTDPESLRKATDQIMKKLQDLSGQEYVDIYASQAKEAIAEAKRRERKEAKKKSEEDEDE